MISIILDGPAERGQLIGAAKGALIGNSISAVDAIAHSLDAAVPRCSAEIVAAELDAAANAQAAVTRAARKVLFEQQEAEWKVKLDDWRQHAASSMVDLKTHIKNAL